MLKRGDYLMIQHKHDDGVPAQRLVSDALTAATALTDLACPVCEKNQQFRPISAFLARSGKIRPP